MIEAALGTARRIAESLMTDRCRIERPADGPGPWDPVAKRHTPPVPTTVWAGRCRVQRPALAVAGLEAGDRLGSVETVEVQVPVAVSGVDVGDVVVIVASGDPALVERRLQVRSDPAKTHATARRLRCEEVTS